MIRFPLIHLGILGLLLLGLSSCDLTRDIEIDLPEYEPEVVVESYLEPGLPFTVILTKSIGFFEDLRLVYVKDAVVTISYNGRTDTLAPFEIPINTPGLELLLDTALVNRFAQFLGESIYLYGQLQPVPELYDTPFTLNVLTAEGEELSAVTTIPTPVDILGTPYRYNDDSLALVLTQFQDDPNRANFYRRVLEKREMNIITDENGVSDTIWVGNILQDFTIDDEITNGQLITFGTGFDHRDGDTLIHSVYSVTAEYARFLETRDAAVVASLSPFGQPATVTTNVTGGQGIFTGQSLASVRMVIGE